jgi:hypothetical protein
MGFRHMHVHVIYLTQMVSIYQLIIGFALGEQCCPASFTSSPSCSISAVLCLLCMLLRLFYNTSKNSATQLCRVKSPSSSSSFLFSSPSLPLSLPLSLPPSLSPSLPLSLSCCCVVSPGLLQVIPGVGSTAGSSLSDIASQFASGLECFLFLDDQCRAQHTFFLLTGYCVLNFLFNITGMIYLTNLLQTVHCSLSLAYHDIL